MRLRAFWRAWTLLAALTAGGPAAAATVDFLGIWNNADADNSGVARLVISPAGPGQLNVQLFVKCQRDCDGGTRPARLYSDDPGSLDIRTIAADFDAGGMHRYLVLRLAVGGALRFDERTDFAANAGRNNFATSGNLVRTGDWRAAVQVAAAAPPPAATAPAVAGVVSVPAPAPPPPTSGGWLSSLAGDSSSSFIGAGAALPPGYVPSKWEECTPFNLDQARVANVDGGWQVADFSHRLLSLGSSRDASQKALAILNFYHFDEECFVSRDSVRMLYWKRAGIVPKDDMPGDDCDALDPASVRAVETDGDWKVVAGGRTLFDFDDDKDAAARAVSVIRTYRLNRQCFFARGNPKAQYWLSQ
ncbi:MAG TPA: hypothetical protein VNU97_19340 [Rhizomicrobium sp.]|jgi:hypothetical protein|nr:hypothetical protein [Rhizomicrobium sp.]